MESYSCNAETTVHDQVVLHKCKFMYIRDWAVLIFITGHIHHSTRLDDSILWRWVGLLLRYSLWPALAFKYAVITNRNLELHEAQNFWYAAYWFRPEEAPVEAPPLHKVLSINKNFCQDKFIMLTRKQELVHYEVHCKFWLCLEVETDRV